MMTKRFFVFLLVGALVLLPTIVSADDTALSGADASVPPVAAPGSLPGAVFRDCPVCPEMVVIPAGSFTMGSSAAEKSWAVSHGATPGSVSDEAPQHKVSLRAFALGKYDVTRSEYAAFVREAGRPTAEG